MNTTVPETTENNTIQNGGKVKNGGRSFKVKLDLTGEQNGRYNGDSPYQAANKALSELIRNKLKKGDNVDDEITFFLVESTKGSSKKTHEYLGRRTKLDTPVTYTVGNGQLITKEYKNILRKVKKQQIRGKKTKKATN